jgi:hypothetical protein
MMTSVALVIPVLTIASLLVAISFVELVDLVQVVHGGSAL